MANRTRGIPGKFSLSDIESAIQFEEAKSFEFLTSTIDDSKDNQVEFKRLALGDIPKGLKLTLDGSSKPAGHALLAGGPIAMLVGGSKKKVKAWRKK